MSPRRAVSAPQLLTVAATAQLLSVSSRTVLNWIAADRIPYIELPGPKPTYRIPLHALLATLRGNYDLAAELEGVYVGADSDDAEAEAATEESVEAESKRPESESVH
jgi:excisionase family DNA binding protein